MSRKQQTVLMTGATRGIGKAAALHLASRGHRVLATGRNEGLLQALEEEARAGALPITVAPLDVTDGEAIRRTVAKALQEFGQLDALVNNAGYALWGPLEELTLDEVRAVFETNLFSTLALCQEVLPSMRERGFGTIVNVGSVAGQIAVPVEGPYSMTKFALHSMSRALRMEVAPFGVRVVLIEPGVIRTDFQANKVIGKNAFAEGSPYRAMRQETALRARARDLVAKGPAGVATRVRQVIEARNPKARYAVGIDARAGVIASRLLPDSVVDFFVRRAVMDA